MEAIANHAWEMRDKFDLKTGVIVNVLTSEHSEGGVWYGDGGADKANCYSSSSTGVAKHTYSHIYSLERKGLSGMVWTDLQAGMTRNGLSQSASLSEFVAKSGATEIFCADAVSPNDVSLAWCDEGAAGTSGVVQIVLPVWCAAARMDLTMRLVTCETAASS